MTDFLIPCAVGFLTGIISAFGIGGGTLLLLAMTLFLGVEAPVARCINLLYFLPTALGSLYFHRKNGYLRPEVIRSAVPAGLACAILGAVLSALLDTALLHRAFGLFLLWAGVSVFLPRRKNSDKPAKKS